MKILKSIFISGFLLGIMSSFCRAATLSGQVKDPSGSPLANVQVIIPALQKGVKTDAAGAYKLENVPAGSYVVEFRPLDYAKTVKTVDLSKGDASLDVTVSGSPIALTPITISARPQAASTLTTPANVTVLEGRQLDRKKSQSIIMAIQDEPGVNMIGEGPTVVKPVIRGAFSQDIVVVQDGIRLENLQWGNEHAPEIDAMNTDRIEVLRGANSLLYGSDALGGVISISHAELPNAKLGAGAMSGKLKTDLDSVNKSAAEGAMLQGAQGDWGWRTDLSLHNAGDYQTPKEGTIPNTGENEVNGSGAVGVRKDWGSLSVDYSRWTKRVELQNPGTGAYPNPLSDDEYQMLNHDNGGLHANFIMPVARIELITGYDRSDRSEFDHQSPLDLTSALITNENADAAEPHLKWIETSYTADLKAHHESLSLGIGDMQGTLGFSGLRRTEQSLGQTHLTPAYNEGSTGEYLYEELPVDKFTFSAGIRSDQTHYEIGSDQLIGIDPDHTLNEPHPVSKEGLNYLAWSGAVGGVYHITDPLAFAVNLGRGYRNPVPFELFGYGVHEGGGVFQIGNPGLSPEVSFNSDASIRWASDALKGEVGVFRNQIHNYIYGTYIDPTTQPADVQAIGLPVVQETQADAIIQGFDYTITGAPTDWLTLTNVGSFARGYNNSNDATLPNHSLPHVPADNMKVGAEVHCKRLGDLYNPYFGGDIHMYRRQDRQGPEEIPTPGYALVGVHTGSEFEVMNNRMTVDAGVDNLLNKAYIDFNSILKEFNIQNPGRNVFLKVSVPFGS